MKLIIFDIKNEKLTPLLKTADQTIYANGQYASCKGCFKCWTKHPTECFIKDSLKQVSQILGEADELVIITSNCYGSYSPQIKKIFDRGIGISTPLSTYRNWQMHHTLRYGKHDLLKIFVYGDVNDAEKNTFQLLAQRNAVSFGFRKNEVIFFNSIDDINGNEL